MRKRTIFLGFIITFILLLTGCGETSDNRNSFSELSEYIVEKVMENCEDENINQEDVVIEQIYHSHFSSKDVEEIFVLCKILNAPHVAGLDKTVALLLEDDSLEQIAYREFNADNVEIDYIPTSNGKNKILYIGTTTYQGISTQEIQLLDVQNNEWIDTPIEGLQTLEGEYFCFMENSTIIVSSLDRITSPANVIAVLNWNPNTEQFILE